MIENKFKGVKMNYHNDTSLLNFSEIRFLLKSSVRSSVLMSLFYSGKTLGELRDELEKPSASILHALRELNALDLTLRDDRKNYLSSKGYLYTLCIIKFFENWYTFDNNSEFWTSHLLDSIPEEFVQSFYLIKDSEVVCSTDIDLSKPVNLYFKSLREANTINIMLPVFSRMHIEAILDRVEDGANVNIITSTEVLNSFREHGYMKKFFEIAETNNITVWRNDMRFTIFLTCSENFMSLNMFFKDRHFDDSALLFNETPDGIIWGKYLFDYFLTNSVKIIL